MHLCSKVVGMNSPKITLAFVRHGEYQQKPETPSAFQPFGLTAKGKEQSEATAKIIEQFAQAHHLKIHSSIYSSNLLRAWQTANIIKDNMADRPQIETSSQINERSVGAVANLTVTEIEALLKEDPRYECPDFNWKSDSYYCLPFDGAESLMDSGERLAKFIHKEFLNLRNTVKQNTLMIIVGHGASFRHAAYLLGILEFEQIAKYSMYHASPLFFEYAIAKNQQGGSFIKIHGEWKVRAVDKTELMID